MKINNLSVSSLNKKNVPSSKSEGWKYYEWCFSVRNEETKRTANFSVYGGSAVKHMYTSEAFYIILREAVDYINVNDIGEFMEEFGYSYKEAKKIYDKLERNYTKCIRVLGSEEEIFKYYDELTEVYN